MIVVADASPLVTLAICDCLNVLETLFGEVRVSQTVFDEVAFGHKPGADKLAIYLQNKFISINLESYIIGAEMLDKGELTSIALYKHLQADYLLIDEKAGRKVAKINHIKIIGSLGVLIEAKRKGIIPLLKPYVELLRQSKTHFGEDLLTYALTAVGE
ncbi:MAG: putative nucleic acid-binding protein, contains PIN domain [Phormidesmis priestleyi Ana]|uniref:Putative nucleic acid-binding protein, contains PIN domain n=1 Tax=Phormidesmis priestleyi Ana TaxID=1666911 RepID=A0A0P7Z8T4_9CYAN|nr:MAG: putative nucleic acid-binding protein, contains PIN domain [Phormidesmis priestleyi Ana]